MKIPVGELSSHLLYCCDRELQEDILQSSQDADVSKMTEKTLLEAIENLAVKKESVLIQRIKKGKMK